MYYAYGRTDTGCIREENQDCFNIGEKIIQEGTCSFVIYEDFFSVCVADGMGGTKGGKKASFEALNKIISLKAPCSLEKINQLLFNIHTSIIELAKNDENLKDMGTTIAGICCESGKVTVFNVGDSKVYKYSSGKLRQVTADDTVAQFLFDTNKITMDDFLNHHKTGVLTQSLGGSVNIEPHIDRQRGNFEKGEIYFLCSDGLSNKVKPEYIEYYLNNNNQENLRDTVDNFVQMAVENGGEDNITLIGVKNISL